MEWLARPRARSIQRHAVATRSIQSRGYRESIGLVRVRVWVRVGVRVRVRVRVGLGLWSDTTYAPPRET